MATVNTFHLWRQYPTAPFYRWAAEVVPDSESPDGYRTLRHDSTVADTAFWHRVSRAMSTEHKVLTMKQSPGIVAHCATVKSASDDDFFDHAVRSIEGVVVGQSPERYRKLNGQKPAGGAV